MNRRFRFSALAACASALALAAAAPAKADPSLWAAKSNGSTVYLFGTVHLLPPELRWRDPAIDRALHDSDTLWLEIALPVTAAGSKTAMDPEALQRAQQLIASSGTSPTTKLSSLLTPDEWTQLTTYMAPLHASPEALEHLRPWLAVLQLSQAVTTKIGWTNEAGADVVLNREALAQGKPVKGFETVEQQLRFFADMSPDVELALLRQSLTEISQGEARAREIATAWSAGNDTALTDLMITQMQTKSPDLYRRLVVARNRAWVPQIEQMLKTPGVRFVAVGDAHLLGPEGVPALLKSDGVHVEHVH
jgi:hypothetical protein